MATAKVSVTEGSGANVASHSISEDAVTKQVQRINLNNSSGAETGVAALPLQVSLANTAANATAVKTDSSAVTQPVSAASLPLPSGAATETTLSALNTKVPAQGQALAAASLPVVLTAAQVTTLTPPAAITGFALDATLGTTNTEIGIVTETAPATDTASSGLNGRLQRVAQRLTSLIALLPAALGTGGGLKVDGSGTALPVSGTVAVSTINSVAPAFGTGVRAATVQRVTIATDDVVPVTDNSGSITVDAPVATPVFVRLSDGAAAITTLPVSVATNTPVGNVAHDAVDSGAPIKMGGRARSSEIAAVASDDRADFITDLVGKQIILPYANPENFVSGAITAAMTATTSTSLLAAPGAGLRNYITTIIVSNAHATVGTDIVIQDGSGGTTLLTIPAAAVYGGAVINLPVPLRQPTANTALFVANVTTGASTKASCVGFKGI